MKLSELIFFLVSENHRVEIFVSAKQGKMWRMQAAMICSENVRILSSVSKNEKCEDPDPAH